MELHGDRILLRRFTDADAPAVRRACDDPESARFLPFLPSPYTEADARAYIAFAKRSWADGSRLLFAIVDARTEELLGSIDVRTGEVGSVGYWIGPEARGHGIATEALRVLARWAIREHGIERLELTTHPENLASQRVAEKAGFHREGVLRSHLRFREGRRDTVMFSLLPSDLDEPQEP